MDSPCYPFPELARMADRGESAHHEFGKTTEIGNDGKTSTANRPQEMCYHGVFIRFEKRQWQVLATFGVSSCSAASLARQHSRTFSRHADHRPETLRHEEPAAAMDRLGSLVLVFATGSILVFFPILAILQALVVDRLRIRMR
jgi:hypothetical protein